MLNQISSALRCVLFPLFLVLTANSAHAAGECEQIQRASGPLTTASKVDQPGDKLPEPAVTKVALRDWIAVGVTNIETLLREAKCRNKPIMVYLDGQPIKDLPVSTGAIKDQLYFRLLRTNASREAWGDILGSPVIDEQRKLNVTVGIEGEPPLSTSGGDPIRLYLSALSWPPLLLAGLCFLGLLFGFFQLVRKSNILRDTSPPEDAIAVVNGRLDPTKAVTNRGTYSLAKLQGAWWFFIIVGAYLLIGVVTYDFYSSVSSTALILLGIGAGTVVGGTLIDVSKENAQSDDARGRIRDLKTRIVQLDAAEDYCQLHARQLDAKAPASQKLKPLGPNENLRLANITNVYGPDMEQWLRTFGPTCGTIADFFELQRLSEAHQAAAAAALAAGAAAPAPAPRLTALQAAYAGQPVLDLCELKALTAAGGAVPPALQAKQAALPDFSSLIKLSSEIAIEKRTAISRYQKLTNQSEGWWLDVLSDANGVSFHRFQLFAWTLILGGVFVVSAYSQLNMPVFDTTLMGLLGLSAGTYLGLKIPEPTIPRK